MISERKFSQSTIGPRLSLLAPWIMVILSILGVIGRFPFTNAPFVNLEYFYSQSSEIIVSGDGLQASLRHLSRAFNNPLGSVLTIALAQGWFGVRVV